MMPGRTLSFSTLALIFTACSATGFKQSLKTAVVLIRFPGICCQELGTAVYLITDGRDIVLPAAPAQKTEILFAGFISGQDPFHMFFESQLRCQRFRQIELPLSFLADDTRYQAQIYRDGDKAHWKNAPYELTIEKTVVSSDSMLTLKLAAGGGMAVAFRAIGALD